MTMRKLVLFACTAALVVVAPVAHAGVTCQTDAAAMIAGAAVNGPRAGWDPPVWTFDMPSLNMSVDVQAYTRAEADGKAQTWLSDQVTAACAAAQPAPAPAPDDAAAPTTAAAAPTTPEQTASAQQLVNAAEVVYVGNSWGPVPLYRVALPSLNMSIDIAANSADEARANALPTVLAHLAGVGGATTDPAIAPAVAPASASAVVAPSTDPAQAPVTAHTLFPDLSTGYLLRAGMGYDGALSTT
jgi:hypothetical protein